MAIVCRNNEHLSPGKHSINLIFLVIFYHQDLLKFLSLIFDLQEKFKFCDEMKEVRKSPSNRNITTYEMRKISGKVGKLNKHPRTSLTDFSMQ